MTRPACLSHVLPALATVALAGLTLAAPAQADSIAYVKGGDLWLAEPDGSRAFQVTATGGYSTVSQSDLGRLVALKGDRIHTLERDGTVVSDILTPVSSGQPGTEFRGPFDPTISPGGTKIAYTYYFQYTGYDPYCNPTTNCYVKQLYQGTGFTRTHQITGWDEPGFTRQSGWVHAGWTGDNEVLLSDPSQPLNEDAVIYSPGDEHGGGTGGLSRWFSDSGAGGLRDGEQTRDAKKLAFVAGGDDSSIRFYRAKGGYPTVPEPCYQLTNTNGHAYDGPSWSPDGSRVAWAEPDGIHTIAIPDMTTDCGTPTEDDRLVIPGASYPDWGPADVPAPRPAPAGGGGDSGGGATAGGGTTSGGGTSAGGAPAPAPSAGTPAPGTPSGGSSTPAPIAGGPATTKRPRVVVKAPRLRTALAKGLTVRLAGAKAGSSATIRVTHGRRTVASRKVRVGRGGTGTATLRFTRAAKRALARRSRVVLVVRAPGAARRLTLRR